jgi:hypothetical protein
VGYIEESLMSGEEVLYRAKLHWGMVFWAIVRFVINEVLLGILLALALVFLPAMGATICALPI